MLRLLLKWYDSSFDQAAAAGNAATSVLGPVPPGETWEVERIYVERADAVADPAVFVRALVGPSGAATARTMDQVTGLPAMADENSPIRLNEREQLTILVTGLTGNPTVNVSTQFGVYALKRDTEGDDRGLSRPTSYAAPQRTHVPAGAEWPGRLS